MVLFPIIKQNSNQFLLVVKATDLKQQISQSDLQIQIFRITALAYTTLDGLLAFFLYNISYIVKA